MNDSVKKQEDGRKIVEDKAGGGASQEEGMRKEGG